MILSNRNPARSPNSSRVETYFPAEETTLLTVLYTPQLRKTLELFIRHHTEPFILVTFKLVRKLINGRCIQFILFYRWMRFQW